MSKLSRKLTGLLLASSALALPVVAIAQDDLDETTTVDALVIRGEFIPDVMRETTEVSTVLLKEDLDRQGDDDIAEALSRTSGLSVSEGRFVYVRGLGERYSAALLNGSPLPSPEPLQRVVPLDLFPTSVLEGAVVQKTFSAAYPGEFGGGLINIQTLDAPARPFFTIGASVGAEWETTAQSGLTYEGGDHDVLGFDDGTRDMPALLRQAIVAGRGRISESTFEDEDLDRIGSSLVNSPLTVIQRNNDIPANFKVQASTGGTFILGAADLGIIAAGGFSNSWDTRNATQEEGFASFDANQDLVLLPYTSYDVESTRNDVTWNGLLGATLGLGPHEINWTNLWVHNTSKEARIQEGFNGAASRDLHTEYTEWFERELLSTQLSGRAELSPNLEVQARAAYAQTTRDAPYERSIRYSIISPGEYLYDTNNANRTSFSYVKDDLASGGIDVTYDLPIDSERELTFQFGAATSSNDRMASQRVFQYQSSGLPIEVQMQRPDFLLSDYNLYQDYTSFRELTGSFGAAAYEAALDVDAYYAQVNAEITPFVSVNVGVRHEDAVQSVTPLDLFGGPAPAAPAPLDNSYWLPAATVTWNFAEDMQLRVGASKTIGRPQFREIAPQSYLDPQTLRFFIGNPYLTDTEFMNYDARLEWYFGRNQFVAAGLFYKDIDAPVETIVNEGGSDLQTTFINAPSASLYGAEIEFRRYFASPVTGGWWDTVIWFVSGNYTYTSSELNVAPGDEAFALSGLGLPVPAEIYFDDGDVLQGQSDHLANLQFGFEDDAGLQATLLVNYGSERVSARGRPGYPDLVVDPGLTVDFTLSREFTVRDHEVEFSFEARNLLGRDFEETQTLAGSPTIQTNVYELGRSVSFGLKKSF